jgi:hypothetical protein
MGDMTEPKPIDCIDRTVANTHGPGCRCLVVVAEPIQAGSPVGVATDGSLVTLHICDQPEALAHDSDTWTCSCGTTYERHLRAWWQEAL